MKKKEVRKMGIYIKDKAVRQFIKQYNKQMKKEALVAMDKKFYEFLVSCVRQWNGNKRIDATVVGMGKL
jgi:tRNA A22 N-methylase